ncbi:MAG TPA: F0F1 ATP synthase subunit B [Pseudolysinimonas sp.]|nr:F0F1 ATP synthase subunit B [Pseudolysinimonas sp.]
MLNLAFAVLETEPEAEHAADPSILIPAIPDLVWGSIAFFLILGLMLWRFVPRINQTLDARADAIAGGIKRADEAQAKAQDALEKYTAQLAEARAEAGKIRDAAREDAKRIKAELTEQAQAEAARIVANAQVQIEAERAAALVSLRSEVGSLAIDLASGVVGESLTDDKKASALVDRFLADLEGTKKAKAGK